MREWGCVVEVILKFISPLERCCVGEFLRQWYSEQRGDYHLFNHVWEQHRLNQVARWPHWRGRVLMVPFRELTGPDGAMVRHLWGGVASEERDRVVYAALEEALGRLQ
ncbi:unnamed protein product [Closterium sp. Yama58-4]|nr:unnamed protein product [Closterium sp. Yama58-4]